MTDSSLSKEEQLSLSAAYYVMGALDADERVQFELRLMQDADARKAVSYWEERLDLLNQLVPSAEPSPFVKMRIERSIDELSQRKPPQPSFWQGTGLWRMATAALLVLSVGLFLLREPGPTHIVVLTAPGQTQPGWMLTSYDGKHIELKPLVATQVPEGKVLEFWTKAEGWEKPVSLGLVDPDRSLEKQLEEMSAITPNQLFELTIEQSGGSPTGLPTGPVQFIGRAVTEI